MKYIITALVFAFIGLGAIEQQIQSGIQKRSKIDRKVDSLMLVQSVERQILLNANDSLRKTISIVSASKDSLKFKVDAHRRVIKLQSKAIKELAGLTAQMDSILSKEVVNTKFAEKLGKRARQIAFGFFGL